VARFRTGSAHIARRDHLCTTVAPNAVAGRSQAFSNSLSNPYVPERARLSQAFGALVDHVNHVHSLVEKHDGELSEYAQCDTRDADLSPVQS
jgi:hypothetical protein